MCLYFIPYTMPLLTNRMKLVGNTLRALGPTPDFFTALNTAPCSAPVRIDVAISDVTRRGLRPAQPLKTPQSDTVMVVWYWKGGVAVTVAAVAAVTKRSLDNNYIGRA